MALAMVMTRASCPERTLATASAEVRSALRTSTFSGNDELDDSRVMAVTLKPAACRALTIGVPTLPEACGGLVSCVMCHEKLKRM